MSALHEAARRVVAAWVSTRPAWIDQCNEAVLALDAALKAQPAQEPVAWTDALKDAFFEGFTAVQTYNDTWLNSPEEAWRNYKLPNIAPQPQRPPLTNEEILDIIDTELEGGSLLDVARAIERKLRGE